MASIRAPQGHRVAVDSSVYFAAARSTRGSARELLAWGVADVILLVISLFVYEETEKRLGDKWPQGLPYFAEVRRIVGAQTDIPPDVLVRQALEVLDDPNDAPVVAAAAHCEADFLATYDRKHLLAKRDVLSHTFGFEVATPAEILVALGLREER
jgi:predicted nucleic acid-binding protein